MKERKKKRCAQRGQHGTEREAGRTGRDAERVTHDATGKRMDERKLWATIATKRENGTEEKKTSGGQRVTKRENLRTGRKRRVVSARRDGKPGWNGRSETVSHERGGGKNNASRPKQQTQPNKLAEDPEVTP